MIMKKTLALLTAMVLALPLCMAAAENNDDGFYDAGMFFDGGGYVRTTDFENEATGIRLGVGGYFNEIVGVRVRGAAGDTKGQAIDEVDVNLLGRIPYKDRAALVGFVVGGLQLESRSPAVPTPQEVSSSIDFAERDLFYIGAGAELDIRLFDWPASIVPGLEWRKVLDSEYGHELVAGISARVSF